VLPQRLACGLRIAMRRTAIDAPQRDALPI
jgi:hypothetical protein